MAQPGGATRLVRPGLAPWPLSQRYSIYTRAFDAPSVDQGMQRSDMQEIIGVEKQRHFIRAMCKSIDGRPVTQSERALLDAILAALVRGKDVSDLIGIKAAHTRRPGDPTLIAAHYLCLTKLMNVSAVAAWRTVGEAWGLKKRDVRWVIVDNRVPALAMLRQFSAQPETLLRLCERHARGARPERRRSVPGPARQSAGNALDVT